MAQPSPSALRSLGIILFILSVVFPAFLLNKQRHVLQLTLFSDPQHARGAIRQIHELGGIESGTYQASVTVLTPSGEKTFKIPAGKGYPKYSEGQILPVIYNDTKGEVIGMVEGESSGWGMIGLAALIFLVFAKAASMTFRKASQIRG